MSENVSEPAPEQQDGGQVEERSLGDVLQDPYVAGAIVNAGTAAVGWAVGHFTGGSGDSAPAQPPPPPPADEQ
jgi:hypothetical protein